MAAASSAGTSTGLARGAIGLREVLFQSVTWFLIGVAVLLYLYARHPGRLPEMKRVFADEPLATAGKS
jgi:hypothetical protein